MRCEPRLELARSQGLPERELRIIEDVIQEHIDDIASAWHRHFPG
ncbi:MAG: DUF4160 domain-containing protein [Deltaproteobacteria bacterium]|nr:DUF4160 domain-containing protein [Deltaproteobacteria bacterium]